MYIIPITLHTLLHKKPAPHSGAGLPAERGGFEPPEVLPSTVFETATIDHSAIFPLFALRLANVQIYPFTYAILTIKLPRGFYLFIRLLDFDEFLLGGNSLTI